MRLSDFAFIAQQKVRFFVHEDEFVRIDEYLALRLKDLADQIQGIIRATQEWQRADGYHQTILARLKNIDATQAKITEDAKEAEEKLTRLANLTPPAPPDAE